MLKHVIILVEIINTKDNKQHYQFTQDIFNSIPALVAYLDNDMNFLLVNKAYANADFNNSKGNTDYYIGKNHFVLYPNEENEQIFRQVVKTQKSVTVYDKLFEYPDARRQYFDWYLIPITKPAPGLVLTIFETSERTLAQLEVKNLAYNLDQITTYSNEAICIIEQSGKITFANLALSSLLGFNQRFEVINQNLLNFFPEKNRSSISSKLENDSVFDFRNQEIDLVSKKGSNVTSILTITRYNAEFESNESTKTFLCLFLDITKRKKQELELLNQRNELYLYSSFIAHDLRNNLNKINQYYFSLKNELENLYPDFSCQNSLNKINEQILHLDHLIQRTLELAEKGKVIESIEPVNLKIVIDEVLDSLVISKSNIDIELPSKYPLIKGEKVKLYQLFLNLFANALRHSNPTKIFFTVKKNGVLNNQDTELIKLKYDGTPFPKELIKNFHEKKSINGLGIQIINSIIDAHKWNWGINIIEENNSIFNEVDILVPRSDLLIS